MRTAGLRTEYFHGFSPEIFHRSAWLPAIGFEERYFHPELRQSGLRDCGGPFRGSCDEDVINHVGDYLAKDPEHKHFTQILTLNSHLPVSPDEASSAILRCGEADAMISDEAACNLMGLVIRAERAVAKVAIRPDLPETEFLIVGDHAPPFMRRSRRDMFSQHEVPYFQLIPRRLDKNSSQKQ
jgi:phosphoglycerol transferase MdoB-like AlkP superfamily enzyme